MTRTRVKICGVCRPEDAVAAGLAGADAIGMVFHTASERCVTFSQAEAIVAAMPPLVAAIGLFVDATTEAIQRVTARLPLAAVQLHGDESPWRVAELKPMPVIKALRLTAQDVNVLRLWRTAIAELNLTNLAGFVLETAGTGAPGGTGVANDWLGLRRLQTEGHFAGLPPIIAAGGLKPDNVAQVVRLLRPYAVDVSSGTERMIREKSPDRITAFIRAVREADESAHA